MKTITREDIITRLNSIDFKKVADLAYEQWSLKNEERGDDEIEFHKVWDSEFGYYSYEYALNYSHRLSKYLEELDPDLDSYASSCYGGYMVWVFRINR